MQGKWGFRTAYSTALTVNVLSQVEACPLHSPKKKQNVQNVNYFRQNKL